MSDTDFEDYTNDMPPIKPVVWRGRHLRTHPLNLDNPKKIRIFLNQDKYWVNAGLEEVRIKEMDIEYLFSTMLHLLGRAPQVVLALYLHEMQDRIPGVDGPLVLTDPYQHIANTPLFQKLQDRYLKLMANA